ncbi:MAG: glycosyltransferase [Rhodospirillaceae bacterium]|nr:MAG: glycosyltransferase [Rhodospirillaceae bacterium]
MIDSASAPLPGPANPSLHLLFLDPTFHDGSSPGSTRTFDLTARLVASGHRVTVLTTTWGWTTTDAVRGGTIAGTLAGIAVRAKRVAPGIGWSLSAADLNRYARWAAIRMWGIPEVDAVVAATEPHGLLPVAAAFAWWRAIPLIADVREIAPDAPPAGAPRGERLMALLARWGRRAALILPRRFFAASQAVMTSLSTEGVSAERQIQTVLGCDTRLFAFPAGRDNAFLREFPDLAGRPLLVFAGRFTADRDLVAVVNLAAALREWAPDIAVILCGDGPTRSALMEHARSIGVFDSTLRIIAPLARHALPDLLAAATMVLSVPRRNDTAGGFFDALAAGRPVLAFGDSWQRSLVESRGAGFGLPAGEPRAVAREIVEILRDADGLRRAGQQAAALAASRFNLDRIAGEQRTTIESLIADAPRAEILRRRALRAKRIMDVLVSVVGLIVLSPVLLGLAIAIAIKLGRPAFVIEERIGLKGRPFKCFRLRTLTDAEDAAGVLLPDEARTTSFGRFLRKSGLDVLPELINVFTGTMSLVGPRPLPPAYVPHYTPAQRRRHDVRPGMTGLSQVDGHDVSTWEEIFALDLAYVDRLSFGLDCKIILRTVLILMRGGNISTPGRNLPAFDEIMARREGAEDV